jgi:hypothetical protein
VIAADQLRSCVGWVELFAKPINHTNRDCRQSAASGGLRGDLGGD